jgi:hypothetical protein
MFINSLIHMAVPLLALALALRTQAILIGESPTRPFRFPDIPPVDVAAAI